MNSLSKLKTIAFALPLFLVACIAWQVLAAETIKLDDGTTCTVLDSSSTAGGTSSSVTAGNGSVSSSTTVDGKTTTMSSAGAGASSSTGSSVTTGTAGNQAFSMASVTRADGSVVTRRSDGTCSITKPNK